MRSSRAALGHSSGRGASSRHPHDVGCGRQWV